MALIKTSVSLPREDLEHAQRRGLNVSAIARRALREHLDELVDEEAVSGYEAAYAASGDDDVWDVTAGDGIDEPEPGALADR